MPRKKVKLAWIANANARKATLNKRSISLLKKVRELSILCDVDAFVIIYHPSYAKLTVWPSRQEILPILERFGGIPTMEREKNMKNEEIYVKEKLQKLQDQLKECQLRNNEMIASLLMHQMEQGKALKDFCYGELLAMFWYMEEKMMKINMMTDFIKQTPFISRSFDSQALSYNLVDETTQAEGNYIRQSQDSNYVYAVCVKQWFRNMIYRSINNFENGRSQSKLFLPSGNIDIGDDKESDSGTDFALGLPDEDIVMANSNFNNSNK